MIHQFDSRIGPGVVSAKGNLGIRFHQFLVFFSEIFVFYPWPLQFFPFTPW